MGATFTEFLDGVRADAQAEGPEAVAELARLHSRYALARQLAQVRKARKLTQQDLARATGLNQSEISSVEGGRANPTYNTLQTIASALGGTIGFIGQQQRRRSKKVLLNKRSRADAPVKPVSSRKGQGHAPWHPSRTP